MTRPAIAAAIALSSIFAGCAASQKPVPLALTGDTYARVCQHPSMTRAASREAFGCQRPSLAAAIASVNPVGQPARRAAAANKTVGSN